MTVRGSSRLFLRGASYLSVLLALVAIGGGREAHAAPVGLSGPVPAGGLASSVGSQQPESEYAPPRAKDYALSPSDLEPGFRATSSEQRPDGRSYSNKILAPDARIINDLAVLSETGVSMAESSIETFRADSDEVTAAYKKRLDRLRGDFQLIALPATGWSSDQVYSYDRSADGASVRGIALKHHNVIAVVAIHGWERFVTPEYTARLGHIVEDRIHAALTKTARIDG